MVIGTTWEEHLSLVEAEYNNAYRGYEEATKLFSAGVGAEDQENLQLLLKRCEACHNPLFTAFEIILKMLTDRSMHNPSAGNEKSFRSLKRMAEDLSNMGLYPEKRIRRDLNYDAVNEIDLNMVVTTKQVRNDLTHNGILREMRHYDLLFDILAQLIRICDPQFEDIRPLRLQEDRERIFDDFIGIVQRFSEPYCAYVLLADSTWGIDDRLLDNFMSLPWSAVIDLDGRGIVRDHDDVKTAKSRIELSLERIGKETKSFYARKYRADDYRELYVGDKLPYLNYSDGGVVLDADLEPDMMVIKRKRGNAANVEKLVALKAAKENSLSEFIRTCLLPEYNNCVVVSLAECGVRTLTASQVIRAVYNKFNGDLEVVLVRDSEPFPEGAEGWKEALEPAFLGSEINDFIDIVYERREFLPVDEIPEERRDGFWFPARDKGREWVQESLRLKSVQEYFEILHLDTGMTGDPADVEQFYRGHPATWYAISQGCAADTVGTRREQLEKRIRDSFTSNLNQDHLFEIIHKPGIGGTTLGRQIAWNLHFSVPVAVLKTPCSDRNVLKNRINDLYRELKQTPFLILLDTANGITDETVEMVENMLTIQMGILPPVVGLSVKRERGYQSASDRRVPLRTIQSQYQKKVQDRCMEYARRLYASEEELAEHVRNLEANIEPKDRVPLMINLYVMDRNFKSPEDYVASFLKVDMTKETLKVLTYIALYSYYTGGELPGKFVYSVAVDGPGTVKAHLTDLLKPIEPLLLYVNSPTGQARQQRSPNGVKVRHPLLARELLKKCLELQYPKEMYFGRNILKMAAVNLAQDALKYTVDEGVTNVLSRLFARKDYYNLESDLRRDQMGMTSLVGAVMEAGLTTDGIEVLKQVALMVKDYIDNRPELDNSRYSADRHIFGLLARLWAQCARFYRKVDYDEEQMDVYTKKSLSTLNVDDAAFNREFYDLYHMAGSCCQAKLERKLELLTKASGDEEIEEVRNGYEEALNYFNESINMGNLDYGLPSLISLRELVIRHIYRILNFSKDFYKPELLDTPRYEWVLDAKSEGESLLENIDGYPISEEGRDCFNEQANRFRWTEYLGDSKIIRMEMNNYQEKLKRDSSGDHSRSNHRTYMEMLRYELYQFSDNRGRVDYRALASNKKSYERVCGYIDEAMKYYSDKSYSLYRQWFRMAKLRDESFTVAKMYAAAWKKVPVNRGQSRVEPYYYLYLISVLSGQPKQDVAQAWDELQANIKMENGASEQFYDYYCAGKRGIGCLVDREFVRFDEIREDETVSWITGTVVDVSENEAAGWLNTNEVRYLDRGVNQRDGMIFFKPASSGVTYTMEKVRFKFGFSPKRFQAVDRTVDYIDRSRRHEEPAAKRSQESACTQETDFGQNDRELLLFKPTGIRRFPDGRPQFLNGTTVKGFGGIYHTSFFGYDRGEQQRYGGIAGIMEAILDQDREILVVCLKEDIEKGRCTYSVFEAEPDLGKVIDEEYRVKWEAIENGGGQEGGGQEESEQQAPREETKVEQSKVEQSDSWSCEQEILERLKRTGAAVMFKVESTAKKGVTGTITFKDGEGAVYTETAYDQQIPGKKAKIYLGKTRKAVIVSCADRKSILVRIQ